jgi:hypothetical protein
MKKHITMTYIEVLEGMLKRKQEAIKVAQNEISIVPDAINKRRFVELGAEITAFETCLDLAKVMFDGENENDTETGRA